MKFFRQSPPETVAVVSKKQASREFPNIYRIITEVFAKGWEKVMTPSVVAVGVSLILIGFIGWEGMHILLQGKKLEYALENRNTLSAEVKKTEQVTATYQNYRDGYFMEALLNYRLGNTDKSREALQKTLQIDPDFVPGKKLAKLLGKK